MAISFDMDRLVPFLTLAESSAERSSTFDGWLVLLFLTVALYALVTLVVVVLIINFTLAVLVSTRKPKSRVLFGVGWWGFLTLIYGPLAAIPFFLLHDRRDSDLHCSQCGYRSAKLHRGAPCPACRTPWD